MSQWRYIGHVKKWILTLSIKEIKRYEILKMANENQITQREGAKRIGVTKRHFRRLRVFLSGPGYVDPSRGG